MNQWVIQFTKAKATEEVSTIGSFTIIYKKKQVEVLVKKIQPIDICIPGSFPYHSTKVVLWRYDTTTYMGGKAIQFSKAEIMNIAGTWGMTWSSRVFSPKYTQKEVSSPTVPPPKEKFVSTTPTQQNGASTSSIFIPATIIMSTVLPVANETTSKSA